MRVIISSIFSCIGTLFIFPIAVCIFPFWIVGKLTHYFGSRIELRMGTWKEVVEFDEEVGWRPKPEIHTHCSFWIDKFKVQTDSDGFRGPSTLAESELMVFGDSYAFGYGVNDGKAYFSKQHMKSDLRIKAISAPGYNMVQEVMWMRKLSPQLPGKLVVWFVYIGNDLYDNIVPNLENYRRPFIREANTNGANWEIVTDHLSPVSWPRNGTDKARIHEEMFEGTFGHGGLSTRVYSASDFLIEQGRDICQSAGAYLVVLGIPWSIQLNQKQWRKRFANGRDQEGYTQSLPDEKLSQTCQKLDVPFIAGSTILEASDMFPEGHWNEIGHRKIAGTLSDLYHNDADFSRWKENGNGVLVNQESEHQSSKVLGRRGLGS